MPELSDAELRAKVRADLEVREAKLHVKRAGKPVLGMKAAERVHWSTVPRQGRSRSVANRPSRRRRPSSGAG